MPALLAGPYADRIGRHHGYTTGKPKRRWPSPPRTARGDHHGNTLSHVTDIQRVAIVGGIAPMDGSDASTAGTEASVNYTATYVFYAWRGEAM